MNKFWKRATLCGVVLTMVIWLMLLMESLGEPFLQDCFRLGDGGYCADYRYTAFGKMVVAGAVIVPIITLGVFVVGKIKGLEARDVEMERRARLAAEKEAEN